MILRNVINWFRGFSFLRLKVSMFFILITGVMSNLFIKLDLQNLTFQYDNNGASSLEVVIGIIFVPVLFVFYNFWLEKVKRSESKDEEILKIIRDPEVSDSIKSELLKILNSKV